MSRERPKNMAASVRRRLTDLAKARGEDFQLLLTRYAVERLLYRLSQTPHGREFILKGAMLFGIWGQQSHRPTRDVDLLRRGEHSIAKHRAIFRDVCDIQVDNDGLDFDSKSVTAEAIKEDQDYEGVRVRCVARLGQARVDMQIDIGVGDVVTPKAISTSYPTLLEFPAPVILVYSRDTVVAEKFHAMVILGIANSRMKDFYDLHFLAQHFEFDGETIATAIRATFSRRKTDLPIEAPLALTDEFGTDPAKVKQWSAFVKKGRLMVSTVSLTDVCSYLNAFLTPPINALSLGSEFEMTWPPGGPWNIR